jgi:hypothetical protein
VVVGDGTGDVVLQYFCLLKEKKIFFFISKQKYWELGAFNSDDDDNDDGDDDDDEDED